MTFDGLQRGHYGAILADPPWQFNSLWGGRPKKIGNNYPSRAIDSHYETMTIDGIAALPVADLAAPDCVLFMWTCWPVINRAFEVLQGWGFAYKTCAFSWMKADPYRLFADDKTPFAGMGYWTRANTEPCLLATRGKPKRLHADVRQGIIAPRREHSRKPDGIHERIERLVAGPYIELFARQSNRPGWDYWGNQVEKFNAGGGRVKRSELKGDRVLELDEKGVEWGAIALRLGIRRGAIPNFLADAKRRRAKQAADHPRQREAGA